MWIYAPIVGFNARDALRRINCRIKADTTKFPGYYQIVQTDLLKHIKNMDTDFSVWEACCKEKKVWSSEPVYFKTNISNVNNSIDETLFQNYDALYIAITQKTLDKIKLCCQITIQIIYAINAGYKNNQRLTIDQSETNNSSTQLIYTEKIRIRKSQVLFVERDDVESSESFRNFKRANKSSPKCPHTRRAGIRKKKIYDSDGNIIGYKQIKYKSCIIHKEKYYDTVPKKVK